MHQPTITITFTLPDQEAVVEVIKALGADLAFIEARTQLPGITLADHPLAAATPVEVTGNVHQLALPMKTRTPRHYGQAKGYIPKHPGVEFMADLHRDRLISAAKGRSTVDNMVAVLDFLAETYGRETFRVNIPNISERTGLTVPVVTNAITALGTAEVLGIAPHRHRVINWGTR